MALTFVIPEHKETTVRVEGTRVLLLGKRGEIVFDLPWDKAEELGKAIIRQAAKAEMNHWVVMQKLVPNGLKVKRILGIPVITSQEQLECLGNALKRIEYHG